MKTKGVGLTNNPQLIADQTKIGGQAKVQNVEKKGLKGHDGTDKVDDKAAQGNVQVETGGTPAPMAITVATPEAVKQSAQNLRDVGVNVSDAEVKAAFDAAAKAQAQVGKMAAVAVPGRFRVKEDKSRPNVITGWIERRAKGPKDDPRPVIEIRPQDGNVRPFQIPAAAVEGLRSGARIELHLEEQEGGQQTFRIKAPETEYAGSFLGNVVKEGDQYFAVGVAGSPVYSKVKLTDPKAKDLVGQQVVLDVSNAASTYRTASIRDVIGGDETVAAKLMRICIGEGVPIGYSTAAMAEVDAIRKKPLDGKDLRHIPFVTMDNDNSKDLDQAMCIKPRPDGGYDVHYAIADAAYHIKEGGALDREAKRRASTTYLPGRSVPMLPKELSDDLISLLPNVDRRAFVITVSLDKDGKTIGQSFERGIIKSRAQLTYKGVQAFHDNKLKGDMAGKDYSETLSLLRKVGELKIKAAKDRGVIPSDDGVKASLHLVDDKLGTFSIAQESRLGTEMWNEQISLLANEAVAQKMRTSGVKAVYRTQPAPEQDRVDAFREQVAELGVPWKADQSLQAYLAGLDPKDSRSSIIQGLSIRMNMPASYSTEPEGHHALRTADYLHFTAPMRRYGDIVNARILAALVEGTKVPYQAQGDHTLKQVVKLADDARLRERNVAQRATAVLNAAFWQDKVGTQHQGRVVGIKPSSLTVELQNGLQVSVPSSAIRNLTGEPPTLVAAGTGLSTSKGTFKLGEAIDVTIQNVDLRNERVEIAPSSLLKKAA